MIGTVANGRMRLAMGLGVGMALAILAGCGGGGSSTPTTPQQPPSFSSAAMASVIENSTGSFYTATASDPRGQGLTYTIVGGADAAAFTLNGSQLGFASSPNFDLPGDADGNNVYQVQLQVSDGQSTARLDLAVTVTNSREGIAMRRVANGFTDPVAIVAIPGDSRLFVAERGGRIFYFDPATGERTLFYTAFTSAEGERGLRALAVAPHFQTSGLFFILASLPDTGALSIQYCGRGIFGEPDCNGVGPVATHEATNNYGGYITFGADGLAYVLTGDGGGTGDPGNTAQNDASILGKLIRIDRNPDPYAGATVVPFIRTILAKGFRNPMGGTLYNGQLLAGDRGETRDEINMIPLAGGNYGWPFREGTVNRGASSATGLVDPVIDYPRPAGGGVVGGVVYRGAVSSLRNFYIFADESGAIYSIAASRLLVGTSLGLSVVERRTTDFAPDSGSLGSPIVFGEDNQGDLYIANRADEIFKVVAN